LLSQRKPQIRFCEKIIGGAICRVGNKNFPFTFGERKRCLSNRNPDASRVPDISEISRSVWTAAVHRRFSSAPPDDLDFPPKFNFENFPA
jgi:hypothetical protein